MFDFDVTSSLDYITLTQAEVYELLLSVESMSTKPLDLMTQTVNPLKC